MEEYVNTSIENIKILYLYNSKNAHAVFTHNPYGYPLLVKSQPCLIKCEYISASNDIDTAIQDAKSWLNRSKRQLLALLSSEETSREVTARMFEFSGVERINLHSLHGSMIDKYIVSKGEPDYLWLSDWKQGKTGYFLTGHPTLANLWQVNRIDFDAFDCPILTLILVKPFGTLPVLQVTTIKEPLVAKEITSHYSELRNAIASHSYRSIINHARDIIEAFLGFWLEKNNTKPGRDLYEHLEILKKIIQDKEIKCFSDLAYHCANKIRLMHARTHIDRTVKQGRIIEPSLALSCIEDLKEILIEAQLISSWK